jgi:thymidylate kinase
VNATSGAVHSRGLTVALVGLDGAGKTTVAARLATVLDRPTAYVYMGVNAESSNRLLPTTRLIEEIKRRRRPAGGGGRSGRGSQAAPAPRRRTILGAPVRATLGVLRLANRIAEETYRQRIAARYRAQGKVVILDRDFLFDFHASDIVDRGQRSFARRLHGIYLKRFYPRPDLLLFLDAPANVLFARKGEGTVESLTRRRDDYRAALSLVPRHAVIDATRSLDDVTADAAAIIGSVLAGGTPDGGSRA